MARAEFPADPIKSFVLSGKVDRKPTFLLGGEIRAVPRLYNETMDREKQGARSVVTDGQSSHDRMVDGRDQSRLGQ